MFKTDGWKLHRQSVNNDHDVFRFEIHHRQAGQGDEPEGITFLDTFFPNEAIDDLVQCQLHVIVIDNDYGDDDLYFKHYSTLEGDACKL